MNARKAQGRRRIKTDQRKFSITVLNRCLFPSETCTPLKGQTEANLPYGHHISLPADGIEALHNQRNTGLLFDRMTAFNLENKSVNTSEESHL